MDPAATTEITHLITNPALFAALIGVTVALVKLLEITIVALVKKYRPDKAQQVEVSLNPDVVSKLSDMSIKVAAMHSVMSKSDNDGTPMVYSSRSGLEAVRDIAVIIRNVSQTQERLAHVMERLEQKFAEHDRMDVSVQSQINLSLERLVRSFDDHDKRVMESMGIQNEVLRLAQQNNTAILQSLRERG